MVHVCSSAVTGSKEEFFGGSIAHGRIFVLNRDPTAIVGRWSDALVWRARQRGRADSVESGQGRKPKTLTCPTEIYKR
jgi:hypothetical protein